MAGQTLCHSEAIVADELPGAFPRKTCLKLARGSLRTIPRFWRKSMAVVGERGMIDGSSANDVPGRRRSVTYVRYALDEVHNVHVPIPFRISMYPSNLKQMLELTLADILASC
jgi:hypothetical protein